MERPILAEESNKRQKAPEQAATMEEYCELEMKRLEQQSTHEAMLKSLLVTKEPYRLILPMQPLISSSECVIPSSKALSFLEAFMNANCSLEKNLNGTLYVRFQNWLNAYEWHEISMKEVDVIMCAVKKHILEEWKTKIIPAWKVFNQFSPEVSDEQKYFAIVYLYRNFIRGHHLQDTLSSERSSELAQVRCDYQNALEAGDSQKFNKYNRFRLHPDGYTFFYTRETNRRSKGY